MDRLRAAEGEAGEGRPERRARARWLVSSWIPQGRGLTPEDWRARHRVLLYVLALHVVGLVCYAAATSFGVKHGLVAVIPVVLLLGGARWPGHRRARAIALSFGLLICSAITVHLARGQIEAHFDYFVVVALIALYEDWAIYLLVIAFVLVEQGLGGHLMPDSVYAHPGDPWMLAGVNAGFVLAVVIAQVLFWHFNEQSRRRVDHYREQLYEGQQSLMARLAETDRIRSDLVATVSHEFRTPLTGIRASLLTVRRRRDRLSDAQIDDMLDAAVAYSDRLSRLLENMLTAATATGADDNTVVDLAEVISDVLAALAYSPAVAEQMHVDLPPTLPVRMGRQALHQVVANLVDNALTHSWPGAPVRLSAGRVGDEVILRVRNPGPELDPATVRQLFEPFTQRDGSATRAREGAGMGLYVVRRLVEVDGGRLHMNSMNGEIIVEVDLVAAQAGDRTFPPALTAPDPTGPNDLPGLPGLPV